MALYLLPGNVTGLDDVLAESVIILTLLAGTVFVPRLRWAWVWLPFWRPWCICAVRRR